MSTLMNALQVSSGYSPSMRYATVSLGLFIYNANETKDKVDSASHVSGERSRLRKSSRQPATVEGELFRNAHVAKPRARSLAFPATVLLAIVVSLLSLVRPAFADLQTTTLQSQKMQTCIGSSSALIVNSSVVINTSNESAQIRCPVDLFPGEPVIAARVYLDKPEAHDRSVSRCVLFAQSGAGGKLRGVAVERNVAGSGWMDFPPLSNRDDDFRYIECQLSAGARVEGIELEVAKSQVPDPALLKKLMRQSAAIVSRTVVQLQHLPVNDNRYLSIHNRNK